MTALQSPPVPAHLVRSSSLASSDTDADGDSFISDAPVGLSQFRIHPRTATSSSTNPHAQELPPSGPICSFGSRLAYTYFPSPAPRASVLNAITQGRPPADASRASGTAGGGHRGQEGEQGVHWFTIDDQLQYLSFFQDYGPLNVACLYRFCLHLHSLLSDQEHAHQKIFLYSSDEPDKKVNAALLMALYAMVVMRWSVADVLHPLSCLELQPYRDAGYSRADYHLHPQHIIYGLSRALSQNLLDLSTFDLNAYEASEKVETGDWNWLTPGFVAFASPVEAGWKEGRKEPAGGKISTSFRNVIEEFESKGVKVVVRLNKQLYNPAHFTERGIEHVEMYFDDGTNPTMEIVREFIDLSDRAISAGGAVAVHCKAGLGRTGTLIGAYLIYKHGFTADEAIGFMRLMRPGSCVGPQQHFLYENQLEWVRWAARDQLRAELGLDSHNNPATLAGEDRATRSTTPGASTSAAQPLPPVTPKRKDAAVPGQPRKTPGRSRHGVAAPEAAPGGSSPAQQVGGGEKGDEAEEEAQREERMEGVVLAHSASPRKSRSSGTLRTAASNGAGTAKGKGAMLVDAAEGEEEDEEEDELAMLPVAASPQKLLGAPSTAANPPSTTTSSTLAPPASITSSTRPKTPSARPTRIARPAHPRPLSALADNRIVDRLGTRASTRAGASSSATTSAGATGSLARSRAAKNLNTVFETTSATAPSSSSQSRYPLRNGRTLSAGSSSAAGTEPPASPTKLPQRVLGKRVAAASPVAGGKGGGHGFDPAAAAAAAAKEGGGAGVGPRRNVRRRRSSMGSVESTNVG
ncbi:hypothetical protein JCM8547_007896 [Rhodosporidiobolus lusitaniae]